MSKVISPNSRGGGDTNIQLIRRKQNSGGCAVPRNDGIRFACGEYIIFIDSDDAITKTAFEELYSTAKKFDADVIYREKFFVSPENLGDIEKKNFNVSVGWNAQYNFVTAPTLASNSIEERLKDFDTNKYWVTVWNYFIRRDLIIRNDIKFLAIKPAEDDVFAACTIFSAKKIVRVPYINYIYRANPNSITQTTATTVEKTVSITCKIIFEGILFLDNFLQNIEFFQKNPEYKQIIFEFILRGANSRLLPLYAKIPPNKIDEIFRTELKKYGNHSVVTSFILNRMNILNINLIQQNQIIQQLQAQLNSLQK